jgi:hypothetical protein
MSNQVIKATGLDLSQLTFSDVKLDNHGRKMVYINNRGGKVLIQTPKMYVPNGVKRWRKKDATDNKDDSFEMEMSFGGEDKNPDIRVFHEKMQEFDTIVKKQIMAHSKEWLAKPKVSMELIENAYYAPTVRVATDKDGNQLEFPDRMRAKLDRERDGDDFSGRFLSHKGTRTPVMMFDESKVQLDMNETNFESVVPKGSQVTAVLELVYLSITTKVSAKWKLVQARVSRSSQAITGYAMLDDDEPAAIVQEATVQEDLDTDTPDTPDTPDTLAVSEDVPVEESDEDVEEESEEAPEPIVVKKTAVRAKRGVVA